MTRSELRLRAVRLSDEQQVRSAQQDLLADDFDFAIGLRPETPWPKYVEQLDRFRPATQLPEPWVPATFLLAIVGGELVGRTSIRHRLNDSLFAVGGHIGDAVLPAFRRRGFATEILYQSLVVARSYDVTTVLVTCDERNDASARVITRCGGVLENVVENPDGGPRKRRYWIHRPPIGTCIGDAKRRRGAQGRAGAVRCGLCLGSEELGRFAAAVVPGLRASCARYDH